MSQQNTFESAFRDFTDLVAPWLSAYCAASVSYVGLKTSGGPRLLVGRILLEPTKTGLSTSSFSFETTHVVAGRFAIDINFESIKILLERAKGGIVPGGGDVADLQLQIDNHHYAVFSPIHHPFVPDGQRIPSVRINGAPRHLVAPSVVDQRSLDWEVKGAEVPFDSVDDLLTHCGLPTQSQLGDFTTLEVIAKTPALISAESTISDGRCLIVPRIAASLDTGALRVGYKVFRQESIERVSVTGDRLEWEQSDDIAIGTYRASIGASSLVQAFVSYGGATHHQWWITDPTRQLNPRYAIHKVFDEDLELLTRMLLRPELDRPYAFENAVSTLLSLLGFSVSSYGRIPKLQKGPDLIAITPSGNVGVIECTVGLLDENDKLAKLVQRTKLVRSQLQIGGYGFLRVQPIIVTPLSREEVAANLETAGRHEIAVVCRGNLETLLRRVPLPSNPNALFEEAKELVPKDEQPSLFPAGE